MASIASVLALVFFDVDFKFDATKRFQEQVDRQVQPVYDYGVAIAKDANGAGAKSFGTFSVFIVKRVNTDGKDQDVIHASEILDDLVKCKKSLFCAVKDYERYRETIQNFWYIFRPYVLAERNTTLLPDFAKALETEAAAILDQYRKEGKLPSPK